MIKKMILALAISSMSLPVFATATSSAGLGLYNNDATVGFFDRTWAVSGQLPYMYTNPAYASQFTKNAYVENFDFGSGAIPMGGFLWNPMDVLTIGVFVGTTTGGAPTYEGGLESESMATHGLSNLAAVAANGVGGVLDYDPDSVFSGAGMPALNSRNISIIGVYDLAGMPIGLGISYAAIKRNSDIDHADSATPANNYTENLVTGHSELRVTAGTKLDIAGIKLAPSIEWRSKGISNEYKYANKAATPTTITATYTSPGMGDLGLIVAGSYAMSEVNAINFRAGFQMSSTTTEAKLDTDLAGTKNSISDKIEKNTTSFAFGASDEIKISNIATAFIGFDFVYYGAPQKVHTKTSTINGTTTDYAVANKVETDTSNILLPVFIGVNAKLTEGLTARFGAYAHLLRPNFTETNTTPGNSATPGTVTNKDSSSTGANANATLTFGLSYQISQLRIDWLVQQNLIQNGPFLISGVANGLGTAFAVSYSFDAPKSEK